jgi:adenylate cyclase
MKSFIRLCYFFLLLVSISIPSIAQMQGQPRIDSLEQALSTHSKNDSVRVRILSELAYEYYSVDATRGVKYASTGIAIADAIGDNKGKAKCLNSLGLAYWAESDYPNALDSYITALQINEDVGDKVGITKNLGNIGLLYLDGQDSTALIYFSKALKNAEELKESRFIPTILGNIGLAYHNRQDYQNALSYFFRALTINRELKNNDGLARMLGNIGRTYLMDKKHFKAVEYCSQSNAIFDALGQKRDLAINYGIIAEAYIGMVTDSIPGSQRRYNNLNPGKKRALLIKAVESAQIAITYGTQIIYREGLVSFYDVLSRSYWELGDSKLAWEYFNKSRKLQDSLYSKSLKTRFANIEILRANNLKAKELIVNEKDLQKQKTITRFLIAGAFLLIIFLYLVWHERRKSEKLLLNILPESIAVRLKKKEKYIADHFEEASVVFVDISQFTLFSRHNEPERVVEVLNTIYTEFDKIAAKYKLEKIKTIGDCYMAAAGVPFPFQDHATAAACFAVEAMHVFSKNGDGETGSIIQYHPSKDSKDGLSLSVQFRCGIDCGPVVAGVIGENKFIYDLWGDTVNTAFRMEEYGEAGKIQVTERFRKTILNTGKCSEAGFVERGELEIKGKGTMKTWYMSGEHIGAPAE